MRFNMRPECHKRPMDILKRAVEKRLLAAWG
jgi:hypothetical protein